MRLFLAALLAWTVVQDHNTAAITVTSSDTGLASVTVPCTSGDWAQLWFAANAKKGGVTGATYYYVYQSAGSGTVDFAGVEGMNIWYQDTHPAATIRQQVGSTLLECTSTGNVVVTLVSISAGSNNTIAPDGAHLFVAY